MNTNELTHKFHEHLILTYNDFAPTKVRKNKRKRNSPKPWLTKGILISIKIKRNLFKQFKDTGRPMYYTCYKLYRYLLKKLIRKSKKAYYTS